MCTYMCTSSQVITGGDVKQQFWAQVFMLVASEKSRSLWVIMQKKKGCRNSRVIHLTESRWPNENDWAMITTNLNNGTWPNFFEILKDFILRESHAHTRWVLKRFMSFKFLVNNNTHITTVTVIWFVVVKMFWSNSNQVLVILIWSSDLASEICFYLGL